MVKTQTVSVTNYAPRTIQVDAAAIADRVAVDEAAYFGVVVAMGHVHETCRVRAIGQVDIRVAAKLPSEADALQR